MGRVLGKTAIVTGGGLGLGRASALMLAQEGAKVVVTDVNEDEGRTVVETIDGDGGQALFVRQDVASEAGWAKVMEQTLHHFSRLDVLVNNAGVAVSANVEET